MLSCMAQIVQKYRELFEQVRALRSEIDYEERLIEQTRTKIITDFESWYTATYPSAAGTDNTSEGNDDVR